MTTGCPKGGVGVGTLGMRFVLHGTLGEYVASIMRDGLRVRCNEPSFTADLSLATCKYAHRARNTVYRYSGRQLADARETVARHRLLPTDRASCPDEILRASSAHWDRTYKDGVVFWVSTAGWRVGTPPVARLRIDDTRRVVQGGITKWIENHLALYPVGENSELLQHNDQQVWSMSSGNLYATLPSEPRTRECLAEFRETVLCGRNPDGLAGAIAEALAGQLRITQDREPIDPLQLARSALSDLAECAVRTAARRGFLSILRGAGYRILKTDYDPPYEEEPQVFWKPASIEERLRGLERAVQRKEAWREDHGAAVAELIRLWKGKEGDRFTPQRVLDEIDKEKSPSAAPPSPRGVSNGGRNPEE